MYSTYLDIQNNQSISFHIPGNTISVLYSVAFEAEQHDDIYEGCQSEQNNVTNMSAILRRIDTI
jgi:hypothetical protein